jgi:hypothetical protein
MLGIVMTVEEFLKQIAKRPLPMNHMERVRVFAREMAEGAVSGIWEATIVSGEIPYLTDIDEIVRNLGRRLSEIIHDISLYDDFYQKLLKVETVFIHLDYPELAAFINYLIVRWKGDFPDLGLLVNNGYLTFKEHKMIITKEAFQLLQESDDASVFISYKRSESSSFALLVHDRLKLSGLSPFVDMQLQPGQQWYAELEKNIKNSDYFIILLSNKTLESTVTIQELQWALEAGIPIIPIWHNGFSYKSGDWQKIPLEVNNALKNTHTIRVIEENPLTYDTALRELLNRFGISS